MKKLMWIFLMALASYAYAGEMESAAPSGVSVKGEVLETKNVANFTYLRLKTERGETWAAVLQVAVNKGDNVTIDNAIVMKNFTSKALNKTFSSIIFGTIGNGAAGKPAAAGGHKLEMATPLIPKKLETIDAAVSKASGPDAHSVAEIMSNGAGFKDKVVVVRGKVVKYNADIMGRNWLHLRDGSGTEEAGTNDILVTSKSEAKLGDIVTAKGVVHTDKDFGAGYAYKVLIEDAVLQ